MDRSAAAPLRAVQKTALSYDRGHLLVRGTFRPPGSDWDPALRAYRVPAFAYSRVVAALRCEEADFDDAVWEDVPGSISPVSLPLRDYQSKALESWARAGRRGIVVLPTGSGKTFVGLQAVADLRVPVLV
ncbi:MAG: DEAD/DEAH box helicase family protein, partial [Halobacteria archaeon]